MKTMTPSAKVDDDYQSMVEEGRLLFFGLYILIGVVLGLLWFVAPLFGLIAGA